MSPAGLALHGVLDQDTLGDLAVARIAEVSARARALVGGAATSARLAA